MSVYSTIWPIASRPSEMSSKAATSVDSVDCYISNYVLNILIRLQRLYILSELAQLLLQQKASNQQWSIDEYTGKQSMPADIFAKLPNEEVSKQVRLLFLLSIETTTEDRGT